jgi:hypothetical protein
VSEASDFYRITSVDVARLWGAGMDALVLEVSIEGSEETVLFWMHDAQAFTFIRQMTDVLFDIDPPRCGVETGVRGPDASSYGPTALP